MSDKMTIEKLAEISQKEFLGIREEFKSVRAEMATKQELAAVRQDLKSAIYSSADRVVDEIKTFMQPHVKSLDIVIEDVEKLKAEIKI